jgi:hypothetical protein
MMKRLALTTSLALGLFATALGATQAETNAGATVSASVSSALEVQEPAPRVDDERRREKGDKREKGDRGDKGERRAHIENLKRRAKAGDEAAKAELKRLRERRKAKGEGGERPPRPEGERRRGPKGDGPKPAPKPVPPAGA